MDIQMFDGPHATVVDWGEIVIELEGVQYTLIYNSDTEMYSVDIWLSTMAPGVYTLNFTASAIDCETEFGEIQLEIVPKITYSLFLDADEEVQAGQPMQIIVSATSDSVPVSGLPIEVHILIATDTEIVADITTNSEGLASLDYTIPSEATGLTIWAEFAGSESEWSSLSNTISVQVTSGGIDILTFIISLFQDPLTLTMILGGGCGLGAGVLLLRRRRRRPRMPAAGVIEEIIPPSRAPALPAGEMDVLQDEIKQYPVGLTRTQIAKALDISKSKASALVKRLLESDPRFEETIEGRLRRIRFRGEE